MTDAALVNGLIDPNYFLGGEVHLHLELAKKGYVSVVSARLDYRVLIDPQSFEVDAIATQKIRDNLTKQKSTHENVR